MKPASKKFTTPEAGEKSQATRVSVAEGSNKFCHAFQQLPHDSGNVNGIQFAAGGCHRTIPGCVFLLSCFFQKCVLEMVILDGLKKETNRDEI